MGDVRPRLRIVELGVGAVALVLGIALGCGSEDAAGGRGSSGGGWPPSLGDGNGNGSGDGDYLPPGGGHGGAVPELPEEEKDLSVFRAPVVTGKHLWFVNPESSRVALIDATDFEVRVLDGGFRPTYVAAVPAEDDVSSALVLNVGSGDATWFRLKGRKITDRTFPIAHRANRWAVSPSGRWATAWSAEEPDERLDPTEGLQDITVVDLGVEPPVTHRLTVGYRPSALSYSAGEEELIVVSEAGISLVDLWGSSPVSTGWIDLGSASGRGVAVTPSGEYALVRRTGEPVVSILPLDGSPPAEVQLGGAVTDLELDAEGRRAVAVVREKRQIAVFDVEAAFADPAKVDVATVPGEIFGSVALSPDGDVAALYTTALDSGRVVIADLRAGDTYLETRTVDVKGPVLSVRTTTGGDHAVVLMGKGAQSTNPGSFAVVSLREPRFPRVEATAAPVHQVAVSADYALVTTRDGAAGIFESHLIEMASGRLDKVRLSSPPTAVGILGEQGLGYVAQSHPEGRVTVLNFASATARTLTGFELASKVVE